MTLPRERVVPEHLGQHRLTDHHCVCPIEFADVPRLTSSWPVPYANRLRQGAALRSARRAPKPVVASSTSPRELCGPLSVSIQCIALTTNAYLRDQVRRRTYQHDVRHRIRNINSRQAPSCRFIAELQLKPALKRGGQHRLETEHDPESVAPTASYVPDRYALIGRTHLVRERPIRNFLNGH